MQLEGTVTNVAAFGAFIDIGVHQDGLVHVSQLADRFVKDSHEVVKPGDVVQVRVTEVDVGRKRIRLSMRKDGGPSASEDRDAARKQPHTPRGTAPEKSGKPPHGSGKKDDTSQRGNRPGALGSALLDAM
jgi:uncharacterized protein